MPVVAALQLFISTLREAERSAAKSILSREVSEVEERRRGRCMRRDLAAFRKYCNNGERAAHQPSRCTHCNPNFKWCHKFKDGDEAAYRRCWRAKTQENKPHTLVSSQRARTPCINPRSGRCNS